MTLGNTFQFLIWEKTGTKKAGGGGGRGGGGGHKGFVLM